AAIVISLLYAFLPYHFMRGVSHYFLGTYYLVPLMCYVALRVYQGQGLLFRASNEGGETRWNFRSGEGLAAMAICALAGAAGVYYAFFGCCLLLVGGATAAAALKKSAPLLNSAILIAITSLSVIATLSPHLIGRLWLGPNHAAVQRSGFEAELYGLKITQMILPKPQHRIGFLARLRDTYDPPTERYVNENRSAALGMIGSVGFLWV